MKLIGMLTTYNDSDWLAGALKTLGQLDGAVILEGAYQETINLGMPSRSPDKTCELCTKFVFEKQDNKFMYFEVNETSDVQQRNHALEKIKESFLVTSEPIVVFIVDGDEEYTDNQILLIKQWAQWMTEAEKKLACSIWSKVFVTEEEYTLCVFPRLFLLTPGCKFVDSNLMYWPEVNFTLRYTDRETKYSKILPFALATTHHSYCRSKERFEWKRKGRIARRGSFPWVWDEKENRAVRKD